MKTIGLALRVGTRGLALRKGRAALMMLGVAIGIVTLTVVVSVAKGAKQKVEGGIQNFGPDSLVVAAGSPQFRGPGDERVTTLVDGDVEAIRALPGVRVAMPMVVRVGQDLSAHGNEHMAAVMGATPDYEEAWDWRVASGEHVSEAHEASAARVAVLGATVARELFGQDDPVGDSIRIEDQSFKIIGVLARRGASPMGMDMDNRVVIPLSTAMRRLFNVDYYSLVRVRATSIEEGDALVGRVNAALRERHRIGPAGADDFAVRSPTAIRAMASAMTKKLTTMLGLVSIIALVAGAVVLANILLAAVSERRAEIGLTRALGATRRQVVQQFLVEGVTVTLAGGAAGVIVGALAATMMGRMKMPVAIGWEPFALAVVASVVVGLAAAAVPARRAAAIDPATALRP
jgi:ABC-type antimicrobial peptide transport system permease subunit